jgi:hypothetical protein
MEKDDLDSLLKSKLENNGIPFKESYWIDAQQTLSAQRKGSKKIFWFLLPSLILLTGIFMYAGNLYSSFTADEIPSEKLNNSILSSSNPNHENQSNIKQENNTVHTEKYNTDETQLSTSNQSKIIVEQPVSNIKQKENKIEVSSENISVSKELNTSENNIENKLIKEAKAEEIFVESSSNQNQQELNLPLLINSLQFAGFKLNSIQKPALEQLSISPNKKRKRFISYTSINAGIQMNKQAIPAYHINGLWHVLANHQLSFFTGIGLFQTTPELGKRKYSESTYSFGESNKSIGINTEKLHYVQIPLGMEFTIKGRHALNMAVNYMYLLSSKDQFFYYENDVMVKRESKDSYISLFNQHDILMEMNYGYRLHTKCKISLGYFQGLMQISDSKLFEFADKNKNRGFKLGFQYQLT